MAILKERRMYFKDYYKLFNNICYIFSTSEFIKEHIKYDNLENYMEFNILKHKNYNLYYWTDLTILVRDTQTNLNKIM